MTDGDPVVSIITPSYNCSSTIQETLRSISKQTFKLWEHIIIDDASTDSSAEVLRAYTESESRALLIQFPVNRGAAEARNAGIEAARGRYIAFLDSDDVWHPNKLLDQIEFMKKRDIAFSFTGYAKMDENGFNMGEVPAPNKVKYSDLLKDNKVGCLTAMYDTDKIGKVKMPLIRKRQDLGLWLKILKKTEYGYGIPSSLAKYRIRKGSISSNKVNSAAYTWTLYREIEKMSVVSSAYYFLHYMKNGIVKTYLK